MVKAETDLAMMRSKKFLSRLTGKDFSVDQVDKKRAQNAMLPYPISLHLCRWMLLIQNQFPYSKTMMVAQRKLYEGINIGSGVQGLITYMRTDSTRISPVAQNEAASFITDRFGSKYSKHGSKVKNAQVLRMPMRLFARLAFLIHLKVLLSIWTRTSSSSIPLSGIVCG